MPDNLKSLLVDDWERVTKNGSVVDLPAPKTVRMILQDYRDEETPKRTERSIDADVLEEIVLGLLEYFDLMLDKILLYRYERPQYRVFRKQFDPIPDKGPVDIYGAEHFLRLYSMCCRLLFFCSWTPTHIHSFRQTPRAPRSYQHGPPGYPAHARGALQSVHVAEQELGEILPHRVHPHRGLVRRREALQGVPLDDFVWTVPHSFSAARAFSAFGFLLLFFSGFALSIASIGGRLNGFHTGFISFTSLSGSFSPG